MTYLLAIPVINGTFSGRSQHIDYIIKKNFTCQGVEENLLNCTYHNRNSTYCDESQLKPAGVYCLGQNQGQSYFSGTSERSIHSFYVTGYIIQNKYTVMVRLDSVMDLTTQVAEWRSVCMVYGVQCVMMDGTAMMPPQCAGNWDIIIVYINLINLYHDK